MVKVSKPLCTKRFTGNEFERSSVLNPDVTLDDLNKKFKEDWKKNRAKRMKAQKKY